MGQCSPDVYTVAAARASASRWVAAQRARASSGCRVWSPSDVSRFRSSASTWPSPPTRTDPNGSSPDSIASAASSRQRRRCCRSLSVTMRSNVLAPPPNHYLGEVDLNDVREARKLLEGVTEVTPMAHSRWLSSRTSTQVYLKAENLQRTGSFKIRG